MALAYPTDPALPSNPNPFFQDNVFVRGDNERSFSAQIWANLQGLDTVLSPIPAQITTLQTNVAALQASNTPDYEGLTVSNNAATPNTKIDIAAGIARGLYSGAYYSMTLASAFTKSLATNWAVGTGNGGLDTGSVANSTWYYLWLIKRLDTGVVDVLISASSTAPTMPANYNVKRRIRGAIYVDSAGDICGFTQQPDGTCLWGNSTVSTNTNGVFEDVNGATNPGVSAVIRTLTVPPLIVEAICNVGVANTDLPNVYFNLSSTYVADEAATLANSVTYLNTNIAQMACQIRVWADTSSQVRTRFSGGSNTNLVLYLSTLGWREALSEAV